MQIQKIRFRAVSFIAYTLVAMGVLLIVVAGAYYISRLQSGNDAVEYRYVVSPGVLDNQLGISSDVTANIPVTGSKPIPLAVSAPEVAQFANLYPGGSLNPKYWSEPEWAGSDPYGGPTIPDDFIPVLSTDIFKDFSPESDAVWMRIPSIGVDASVGELAIIDLGDSSSYETPDNIVGHIPKTADPGQQGSGWFFAHLESFAAGEGSIFRKLPNITELIKQDPVDVYIETEDNEFIYRVTQTNQINEKDLKLASADNAQITLVTCWPPRVYDQRILVDATLIAYRPL